MKFFLGYLKNGNGQTDWVENITRLASLDYTGGVNTWRRATLRGSTLERL